MHKCPFREASPTKMIEARIRSAGRCGVLGPTGESNLQGETQLDLYANQALLHRLGVRDNVVALV
jgi:fructose-1,6-bisphosphatase I